MKALGYHCRRSNDGRCALRPSGAERFWEDERHDPRESLLDAEAFDQVWARTPAPGPREALTDLYGKVKGDPKSMKKIFILLVLALAACAPSPGSQVVLPNLLPTATPFIDASYPTAQANVGVPQQTASGVEVRVERGWVEGKNVNADVCYTMPDASDWSIWAASLTYGGTVLQEYGTTLLSLQEAANGQPGLRCDTLTFVVAPDADLSNALVTIEAIGAAPRPEDYCDIYMPKIQQAMLERGTGISLDCVDVNGALTMQIVSKPADMSQEQAEQIVFSDEFYTVKGPWSFPFNLAQ